MHASAIVAFLIHRFYASAKTRRAQEGRSTLTVRCHDGFAQCAPSLPRFKGNYLRRLADPEKSLILDGWNSPTKEAAHSFIPRIVDRNHWLSRSKVVRHALLAHMGSELDVMGYGQQRVWNQPSSADATCTRQRLAIMCIDTIVLFKPDIETCLGYASGLVMHVLWNTPNYLKTWWSKP